MEEYAARVGAAQDRDLAEYFWEHGYRDRAIEILSQNPNVGIEYNAVGFGLAEPRTGSMFGAQAAGFLISLDNAISSGILVEFDGELSGGGGHKGPDNKGPVAAWHQLRFKKCLKMFNARPAILGGGIHLSSDKSLFSGFVGTLDGEHISIPTYMNDDSRVLGLDLKDWGVGDGSPNSGATSGDHPENNRIASDIFGNPNVPRIAKLALLIHELGNSLAGLRYLNGKNKKKIGDYADKIDKKLGVKDPDAGSALESCVFGGIVGTRTGRVGSSREF
jgi:hypothetical protein